ncbi:hypothetical protein Ancab_012737 [Ancistrocladus abbreviatus]
MEKSWKKNKLWATESSPAKQIAAILWSETARSTMRRNFKVAATLLVLGCLGLYTTNSNDSLFPLPGTLSRKAALDLIFSPPHASQTTAQTTVAPPSSENGKDELSSILRRASTQSRTVILTTINEAWVAPNSTFDLFVKSFEIGNNTSWLLKHLVLIAVDEKAYNRCLAMQHHCYFLKVEGSDLADELKYMSSSYVEVMWRRTGLFHKVLEFGYNFIFTDADIMWFRDPFQHFYAQADIQFACDQFNGDSSNVNNHINAGFQYAVSNNRTLQFYKFWYESRKKHLGKNEQDVFNIIKHDPFVKEIGLKMRFLDTEYFSGFCQPSKDLNKVCTMHANCCIGLGNKIHDLNMVLEDWKRYMLQSPSQNASNSSPWTGPHNCKVH